METKKKSHDCQKQFDFERVCLFALQKVDKTWQKHKNNQMYVKITVNDGVKVCKLSGRVRERNAAVLVSNTVTMTELPMDLR